MRGDRRINRSWGRGGTCIVIEGSSYLLFFFCFFLFFEELKREEGENIHIY